MPSDQLDNLVRIGKLKTEPPAQAELDGLIRSGTVRLRDAENTTLSLESRFDLAYNAAHALALAALRSRGYRSENRYLVFTMPAAHRRAAGGAVARPRSGAHEAEPSGVRGRRRHRTGADRGRASRGA